MKIIITILTLILFLSFTTYLTNRISVLETKECLTWQNKDLFPHPENFSNWQKDQCANYDINLK